MSLVLSIVAAELVVAYKLNVTPVTTSDILFVLLVISRPSTLKLESCALCNDVEKLRLEIAFPDDLSVIVAVKLFDAPVSPVKTTLYGLLEAPVSIRDAVMPRLALLTADTIPAGVAAAVPDVAVCVFVVNAKSETAEPLDASVTVTVKLFEEPAVPVN